MAAVKKAKGNAGRKVKDKWKAKEWYNVHAPKMFNEMVIGETPAADPELIMGRTVEVTVQEITGDASKMHIKLKFKITGTDGHEAKTAFIGHDFTSDYVRRLTRRKKTKTDHVVDVLTFDHYVVRIKTMSIAERRIQSSQEEGMRQIIGETLMKMAENMTLSDVVKAVISGDMAKDLAKACRVVIPIKRIDVRKTEVLKVGDGEPESIMEEPEPAAEEEPESKSEPEEEHVIEEAADKELEAGLEEMTTKDAPILKKSKDKVIKKAAEKELDEGLDEMTGETEEEPEAKPKATHKAKSKEEHVIEEAAEKELEAGLEEMTTKDAPILKKSKDKVIEKAAEKELDKALDEMTKEKEE